VSDRVRDRVRNSVRDRVRDRDRAVKEGWSDEGYVKQARSERTGTGCQYGCRCYCDLDPCSESMTYITTAFQIALICPILFYSILLYSTLFYPILFCIILF
jgi:hypothetical protein